MRYRPAFNVAPSAITFSAVMGTRGWPQRARARDTVRNFASTTCLLEAEKTPSLKAWSAASLSPWPRKSGRAPVACSARPGASLRRGGAAFGAVRPGALSWGERERRGEAIPCGLGCARPRLLPPRPAPDPTAGGVRCHPHAGSSATVGGGAAVPLAQPPADWIGHRSMIRLGRGGWVVKRSQKGYGACVCKVARHVCA